MMEKQYDNELKGAVWPENNSQVLQRGHVTIGGTKRYCIIVESTNQSGDKKLEFFWSGGLINKVTEKVTTVSPDISAKIMIPDVGQRMKFGGWSKTTQDGRDYFSIGLKDIEDQNEEKAPF
jgi:hypothetical protein